MNIKSISPYRQVFKTKKKSYKKQTKFKKKTISLFTIHFNYAKQIAA